MRVKSIRFWLAALPATALLVGMLVLLYGKSQHFDEADYLHDVGTLRHLKQLDAQWELDVLRSRIGVNPHYDALAETSGEMDRLLGTLEADLSGPNHDDVAILQKARSLLVQAVRDKAQLVEQFKLKNSVLRNSLAFLPTAADDIVRAIDLNDLGPRTGAEHKAAADVNNLLLSAMLYSQEASDQRAAEIESSLAAVKSVELLLPRHMQERLHIFFAHVRIIASEQKTVNELVMAIAVAPTGARIDGIYRALETERQGAAAESHRYRQYLLMFSVALLGLLLYAGARLLRQAETDRANRALHRMNEQLEHRVQERTVELQATQGELVATARRAGRAEIATNVLHNVGNILNSVNVSAGIIANTLRRSRAHGLSRAMKMMGDHAGDLGHFLTADEKGRLLPAYLSGAAASLAQEQQTMLEELGHLTKSIDHIKDVVSTQQSYAGGGSLVEPAHVAELAEDALRMNAGKLAQHKVTVIREFMDLPEVRLDRARVLQILVNLIGNASQAMEDNGEQARRMMLRVSAGDARLRISVQDEGTGITAENLTRIFSHGFTTRAAGHGFGLHSCALAARQMGGTLAVHSDGPGRGATFTLDLPLDAVPVAA
jgi:two-component system, NtrC family, sensor kinase